MTTSALPPAVTVTVSTLAAGGVVETSIEVPGWKLVQQLGEYACGALNVPFGAAWRLMRGSEEVARFQLAGRALKAGETLQLAVGPPAPEQAQAVVVDLDPAVFDPTPRDRPAPALSLGRFVWIPEAPEHPGLYSAVDGFHSPITGKISTIDANSARQFPTRAECEAWIAAQPDDGPVWVAREHGFVPSDA